MIPTALARLALGLVFVAIAVAAGTGCVPLSAYRLETLPLPEQTGNCCWQALQQVELVRAGQTHRLQAVLAREPGQTQLILLDPLGRRFATARQTGKSLQVTLAPAAPADLPVTMIYKLAALTWLPRGELHAMTTGPWTLETTGLTRVLRYRERALVEVTHHPRGPLAPGTTVADFVYDAGHSVTADGHAVLSYPRAKLTVTTNTLSWEVL